MRIAAGIAGACLVALVWLAGPYRVEWRGAAAEAPMDFKFLMFPTADTVAYADQDLIQSATRGYLERPVIATRRETESGVVYALAHRGGVYVRASTLRLLPGDKGPNDAWKQFLRSQGYRNGTWFERTSSNESPTVCLELVDVKSVFEDRFCCQTDGVVASGLCVRERNHRPLLLLGVATLLLLAIVALPFVAVGWGIVAIMRRLRRGRT